MCTFPFGSCKLVLLVLCPFKLMIEHLFLNVPQGFQICDFSTEIIFSRLFYMKNNPRNTNQQICARVHHDNVFL